MSPFVTDMALHMAGQRNFGGDNKIRGNGNCKQRINVDWLDGLFFQETEFNGMGAAAAPLFVAGLMGRCIGVSGPAAFLATAIFMSRIGVRQGMPGHDHFPAMADCAKVGCEYSQQEERFESYDQQVRHALSRVKLIFYYRLGIGKMNISRNSL